MAVSVPAGRRAPLAPPPGCGGSSGSRTPAPPAWRTTPCPRQSRHRWTSAGCGSGRPSPRCGLERGGRRVGQSKDSNFSQRDSIHHCNQSISDGAHWSPAFSPNPLPQPLTLPHPHLGPPHPHILTHPIYVTPTSSPTPPSSPTPSRSPHPTSTPQPHPHAPPGPERP